MRIKNIINSIAAILIGSSFMSCEVDSASKQDQVAEMVIEDFYQNNDIALEYAGNHRVEETVGDTSKHVFDVRIKSAPSRTTYTVECKVTGDFLIEVTNIEYDGALEMMTKMGKSFKEFEDAVEGLDGLLNSQ